MQKRNGALHVVWTLSTIILFFSSIALTRNFILGTLSWHIKTPETFESLVQAVFIVPLLALTLRFSPRRLLLPFAFTFVLVSAFVVGAFGSFASSFLALATIILGGDQLAPKSAFVGVPRVLTALAYGYTYIWIIAASLSVFGSAQPAVIWALFAGISIVGVVIRRGVILEAFSIGNEATTFSWSESMLYAVTGFLLFCAVIKGVVGREFDSLHYADFPAKYFIGSSGSLFDPNGVIHRVHYAPKGLELLQFVGSRGDDIVAKHALNIGFLLLLLFYVFVVARRLSRGRVWASVAVLLVCTVPPILGNASTGKTETLSVLFVFAAFSVLLCSILESSKNHRSNFLGIALFVGLAYSVKQTALFFGPVILFIYAVYLLLSRQPHAVTSHPTMKWDFIPNIVLISPLLITLIRNCLITGQPFFPLFGALQQQLGFQINFPFPSRIESYRSFEFLELKYIFTRLVTYFLAPEPFEQVAKAVPGLIMPASLFFLPVLAFKYQQVLRSVIIVISIIAFSTFVLISASVPDGGDSNYYNLTQIVAIIGLCAAAGQSRGLRAYLITSAIIFVSIPNLIVSVVHHPSWVAIGTGKLRLSSLSIDSQFLQSGVEQMDAYRPGGVIPFLLSRPSGDLVIGSVGRIMSLFEIPQRFEYFPHNYGNSALDLDKKLFSDYLAFSRPTYFVWSKRDWAVASGALAQQMRECVYLDPANLLAEDSMLILVKNCIPH